MHILHQGEGGFQLGEKAGHGHSHGDGDDHGHGHGHGGGNSLAVDAAFLHALSDMIMSIGVVIAASVIEFYGYKYPPLEGTPEQCAEQTCYDETDGYWNRIEIDCVTCTVPSA